MHLFNPVLKSARIVLLMITSLNLLMAQTAEDQIRELKASLKEKKDKEKVMALKDIGLKFRSVNYDSAWFYTELAYTEAEKLKDEYLMGRMLISFGILENGRGNAYSALAYYQKALPAIEISDDHYAMGALYTNISNAYENTSEADKSVEFQLKALEEFKLSKDSIWIAGSFNNLGSRYQAINEWNLSLEYFQQALELYEKLGNTYYQALTFNNLASVYLHFKDYSKVIDYSDQSYEIFDSLGMHFESAYPLYNLGYGYQGLGKLDKAKDYFQKALIIQQEKGDQFVILHLQNDIANVLLSQKNYAEAERLALEAYQKAIELNLLGSQEELLKTLSRIYEGSGRFKEAYYYLEKNALAKDSLQGIERVKEVLNLKEKYETGQKENQILRQENELIENELELKKRNNLLVAGSGLVILILVSAFALLRIQRVKAQRMENEAALQRALIQAQAQESLKEQRIRIASDLHDNIGSQLTYITSITDTARRGIDKGEAFLAEKLTQMKQFTLVTIAELRDTIWAMNKEEISLEDIQERTQQLAATVHDATDDRVRIVIENSASNKVLSPFVGMNLFRIIQESVNNAVKHAETAVVQITFKEEREYVIISISDFGKGFEISRLTSGNGLHIMKNRAFKAGAELKINSEPGTGTQVMVYLKNQEILKTA